MVITIDLPSTLPLDRLSLSEQDWVHQHLTPCVQRLPRCSYIGGSLFLHHQHLRPKSTSTSLIKGVGQFLPPRQRRSTDGRLWRRRFCMAILVVSIIVWRSLVERWLTPVQALGRRVGWNLSRGTLLLPCASIRQLTDECILTRFKSLRFLLTNSKVPRDTKKLVAGVGEKKASVSHTPLGLTE